MVGILLLGSEKPVICNEAYHTQEGSWVAGRSPQGGTESVTICKRDNFAWIGPNILNASEQGGMWVLFA